MSQTNNVEIQRLRGVAVVLTLVTHLPLTFTFVPWWLREAWGGVDLFFVISGFVITRSLLRTLPITAGDDFAKRMRSSAPALKAFYVNRVHRIFPVAILGIAIHLLLAALWNKTGAFGQLGSLGGEAVAIVTGIYNYTVSRAGGDDLAIYWSLMVEEHFYLILPFALVTCATLERRMLFAIAGIVLVAFFLRPFVANQHTNIWDQMMYLKGASHRRFDAPLAGVLLALVQSKSRNDEISRAVKYILVPALFFLIAALPAIQPNETIPHYHRHELAFLACATMSASLVYLAGQEKNYILSGRLWSKIWEYVGSRSFGLYIFHKPLFVLRTEITATYDLPFWLQSTIYGFAAQCVVILSATILLTELVYRFVESPLRTRGRRLAREILNSPSSVGKLRRAA